MPEADTIDRVKSRKVQVASLPPADSGRGFARLPDPLMEALGLSEGDVIEIVGKRTTAARASSVLPVPGGPWSRTPLGGSTPRRWNSSG